MSFIVEQTIERIERKGKNTKGCFHVLDGKVCLNIRNYYSVKKIISAFVERRFDNQTESEISNKLKHYNNGQLNHLNPWERNLMRQISLALSSQNSV